ncbi:protein bric-a-brac 1-like isoform X2 [Homarus americanus]|uniref:protein bric-a-brac 1-like isoform X2 n=1 Tax=Homarus americanus TaxID=6706 RepID=UPI001C469B75|nr:protein bric-a-brac 1-like isoform X2 [Homarus americanus]
MGTSMAGSLIVPWSQQRSVPQINTIIHGRHLLPGSGEESPEGQPAYKDTYQAQVQAAWQKSWNQTQSLLQNLRFRERGPLKSWRPETMAEAIHAVLKEGLSLSQAARKYDIPYPTFVLYANRVHNLLGPSQEPGDMRPKGRGRPQRILLGSWPEEQIKGVIRAVVFRDTSVFKDNEHKLGGKTKEDPSALLVKPNGPVLPNVSGILGLSMDTPDNGSLSTAPSTPASSTPAPSTPAPTTPIPTPSTTPIALPLTTPPTPGSTVVTAAGSPISSESRVANISMSNSTPPPTSIVSACLTTTTLTSSIMSSPVFSLTNSINTNSNGSITSNGEPPVSPSQGTQQREMSPQNPHQNQQQEQQHQQHQELQMQQEQQSQQQQSQPSQSQQQQQHPQQQPSTPQPQHQTQHQAHRQALHPSPHPGPLPGPHPGQHPGSHPGPHPGPHHSPLQGSQHAPLQGPHRSHLPGQHSGQQHQGQHQGQHQQHPQSQHTPQHHQAQHPQLGGLLPSGLPSPLATSLASPVHLARLFGEGTHPHLPGHQPPQHPQAPISPFHPAFPRHPHPSAAMQVMNAMNSLNAHASRMNSNDIEPSPEALLFNKLTNPHMNPTQGSSDTLARSGPTQNQFDNHGDASTLSGMVDRASLMYRDGLDVIKSEPEPILN